MQDIGTPRCWFRKRGYTGCCVREIQQVHALSASYMNGQPRRQKRIVQHCVYTQNIMPRLSLAGRHQAIEMLQAGMSQGEVAAHFQCHRNTISALLRWQREQTDVSDRPRSGRRLSTARQDRWIHLSHIRNRCLTATDTARLMPGNRGIHPITIRRRLREIGLRPCRPAIRRILTQRHRHARLQWCRTHVRHPIRWWSSVMFTDESRFQLSHSDGRIRLYRRRYERYADCCIVERDRYGGRSVRVLGSITSQHRTICLNVDGNLTGERYRDGHWNNSDSILASTWTRYYISAR